jgi:hypothetical protein
MVNLTLAIFTSPGHEPHPGFNEPGGQLDDDRKISVRNSLTDPREVRVFWRVLKNGSIDSQNCVDVPKDQSRCIVIPNQPAGAQIQIWVGPWWSVGYSGPDEFFIAHPAGSPGHHTVVIGG